MIGDTMQEERHTDIDLGIVSMLTKFKRSKQLRQGVADRYPRNKPCPCGSGKKYKHCCWSKGNAPGKSFHSQIFWEDVVKIMNYNKKKQKEMDNDDSSALQERTI